MDLESGTRTKRPRRLASALPLSCTRRALRCQECVRSKLKCSSTLPCERCFKLCLNCVPAKGEQSVVEVAVKLIDPRTLNEKYLQALRRVRSEDELDLHVFKTHMRNWRAMSLLAGRDVSWGLFDTMCKELRISPAELEGPDNVFLDRSSRVQLAMADPTSFARPLDTSVTDLPEFKHLDDGVSMVFGLLMTPIGIHGSGNEVALRFYSSCVRNDVFTKSISTHGLPCAVDPEDRVAWYEMQIRANCRSRRMQRTLVKMCRADGDMDLYYVRAVVKDYSPIPGSILICHVYEQVPRSKHITRRPGHHHAVTEIFKGRPNLVEAAPRQANEEPRVTVPCIATVPLALPPSTDTNALLDPSTPISMFSDQSGAAVTAVSSQSAAADARGGGSAANASRRRIGRDEADITVDRWRCFVNGDTSIQGTPVSVTDGRSPVSVMDIRSPMGDRAGGGHAADVQVKVDPDFHVANVEELIEKWVENEPDL